MSGLGLLLAFLIGMSAGAMLTAAAVLLLALGATRKRQEHLDQLIAGGRR